MFVFTSKNTLAHKTKGQNVCILKPSMKKWKWILCVLQKILRRGGKNTQKNCTKKIFTTQIITMVLIIHPEPDILECEVKRALENITMNKASAGDGIPVELFQILEDDAVKVLHSICQQIWKTQQWPQDWKRCFHSNSKERQCQRMLKLLHNYIHLIH